MLRRQPDGRLRSFRTAVPFRILSGMGRPRAEQWESPKDVRRQALVDEAAIDRVRTDRVQAELPLTFRGYRDELHFVRNQV